MAPPGTSRSDQGWFAENGLSPIDTKVKMQYCTMAHKINGEFIKVVPGWEYKVFIKDNKIDFCGMAFEKC